MNDISATLPDTNPRRYSSPKDSYARPSEILTEDISAILGKPIARGGFCEVYAKDSETRGRRILTRVLTVTSDPIRCKRLKLNAETYNLVDLTYLPERNKYILSTENGEMAELELTEKDQIRLGVLINGIHTMWLLNKNGEREGVMPYLGRWFGVVQNRIIAGVNTIEAPGFSLEKTLKVEGRTDTPKELSPEDKVRAIYELSRILREEFFSRGILHCDVKAGNVVYDPQSNRVTVIDYDLAHKLKRNQEYRTADEESFLRHFFERRVLKGTPRVMAPELWRGEKPSIETEVYAIGATLTELVYGKMIGFEVRYTDSFESETIRAFRASNLPTSLAQAALNAQAMNPKKRDLDQLMCEMGKVLRIETPYVLIEKAVEETTAPREPKLDRFTFLRDEILAGAKISELPTVEITERQDESRVNLSQTMN